MSEIVTKNGYQFVENIIGREQGGRNTAEKINRLFVVGIAGKGVRVP
ncbi:MAG: hypothetical protein ACUVSK_11825 [Desulfotomaculales bacterium]